MTFEPSIITSRLGEIGDGLLVTFQTWSAGVALGLLLGLLIAILQLFGGPWLRAPLRAFIELIRATPFLVQLFLLYYGGPSFGLDLQPISAGILGLGVYGSVYFAEIFRAGFQSVPPGQLEAAECLGIGRWQCILRIQLPQMLVIILPALVNLVTILCKETAVLSIITIPELTMVLTGIGSETFAFVETLLVLCIGYLVLIELCSRLGLALEARVGRFLQRQEA
ncbi:MULTISPECIES: amino acid ABC transporter permease [unclassified Pseudomonas]|uniref:amino acid ABC transporter permease n=1 Tax=unclassified Pseudomonas TaxID=196821 RepID=UPI0002A1A9A8|nr:MULTISPECIES: amino acid ABC transporter permease [unclassified Pseudomonas]MBB1610255.1 amino acid ABC transporter [Pseudomonas sp. UMC76]MBB1639918.1 amino acid ABC transporter [Pseudomonas sp. UME83]NTX90747.1 amino acid ABC transporter permease [Pseudomonas sp. UMA643]NTY17208.1 amino acid ABC transporter permease [Pseudomonas sp. UMC3103]NTY26661.1 amino acid ABC transporter permease [Pseudomonas sp. UMA603]